MISKLTLEQEALIPVYLQKWLDVGYRTAPLDKAKAEKAIEFTYKLMSKPMPQIIYAESPMAGLMIASLRTESQLESQLGSQLRSQLWSQLESQLGSQLRSQLWSQLGSQLESQLGSQLWSQLRSQLGSPDNWNMYYYFYYDYVLNVLFPEKRKDFTLFLEWLEHVKELHKYYCYEGVCIAVEFPTEIHLKDQKILHNTSGMALRYKDGYGMFAVEGKALNADDFAFSYSKLGKHLQGINE
jgi:hypothetical protein